MHGFQIAEPREVVALHMPQIVNLVRPEYDASYRRPGVGLHDYDPAIAANPSSTVWVEPSPPAAEMAWLDIVARRAGQVHTFLGNPRVPSPPPVQCAARQVSSPRAVRKEAESVYRAMVPGGLLSQRRLCRGGGFRIATDTSNQVPFL